jgi:hypothetical protein
MLCLSFTNISGITHRTRAKTEENQETVEGTKKPNPKKKIIIWSGVIATLLIILENYLTKEKTDTFYTLKWDGKIPEGMGKWKKTRLDPFAPLAGSWRRWIIDQNSEYNVPEPINPTNKEYQKEKKKVQETVSRRTASDVEQINFWGGLPGTESPAGIWQNVMYRETKDLNLQDADHALTQKILSQTLADTLERPI